MRKQEKKDKSERGDEKRQKEDCWWVNEDQRDGREGIDVEAKPSKQLQIELTITRAT